MLCRAWEAAKNWFFFPPCFPYWISSRGSLLLPLQPRLKSASLLILSACSIRKGTSPGLCVPEDFIYSLPCGGRGAGEGCSVWPGQLPPLLLPPHPPSACSRSPSQGMCLPPTPRASVFSAINDGLRLPELWTAPAPARHQPLSRPGVPEPAPMAGTTAPHVELLSVYLTGIKLCLFLYKR